MGLLDLLASVATPDEIDISEVGIEPDRNGGVLVSIPGTSAVALTIEEALTVHRRLGDAIESAKRPT